jgi:putative PIN family toxin of toxin-antitoxin system
LDALTREEFQLVTADSILRELADVLSRPRRRPFPKDEIEATVHGLQRVAQMAAGAYVVKMVLKDPDDDHVIATALETQADYIVAEDKKHLLSLKVKLVKGFPPIQIIDARDFLALLRSR